MLPILNIGPWQVGTYRLLIVLAVTVMGTYAFDRLLQLDHPPGRIGRCVLLTILGGYGTAYLIPYLINLQRTNRSGILARPEGMSIIWALIGSGSVAAICCWRYKASLGRVLDLAVLPVPLGQAIGRLGCFAAGCCYGRPTDSWLGMYLPDDNGLWMVRYPTQLMSAAANLLIFLVLLAVESYGLRRATLSPTSNPGRGEGARGRGEGRLWPFDGFLALLYVDLFSLKRFVVGFLRESGSIPMLGPFSWMHLNALAGLVTATVLILWNLYRNRKEEKPHEPIPVYTTD